MKKSISRPVVNEPYRSTIFLGSLLILRAVGQILLFRDGFLNVSADEFSRGIAAAQWALEPRFDLFAGPPGAWLPLERYVNGLALTVWPDVILAPRLTVFLSSCLVLIALYVLVYYLFDNFTTAALASVFVALQPWYVWLSGTPMLEMYYLGFYIAGLYFLLAWLKDNRRGYWILAGLSFLIASGYHVQSWYLLNLVNLLTIGFLIQFARRKQFDRLGRLIAYYFLSNGLIIIFLVIEYYYTGQALAFLSRHTSYSRWFYGGYNVHLSEKLAYYPNLILNNISAVVWPLMIAALVFLRSDRDRAWKLVPLILAILSLAFSSMSNVLSGPPSAAPARYSLFYTLMLAPYIAYGTYRVFQWGMQRPLRVGRFAATSLLLALFVYSVIWGAVRTANHPGGAGEAVAAGRYLHELLNQTEPDEATMVMLELRYWDFLAVKLAAGHFDNVVYDRVADIRNRQTPSIFEDEPDDFYDTLSQQNIRYVALFDPDLKMKMQHAGFLPLQQELGAWTIYRFDP